MPRVLLVECNLTAVLCVVLWRRGLLPRAARAVRSCRHSARGTGKDNDLHRKASSGWHRHKDRGGACPAAVLRHLVFHKATEKVQHAAWRGTACYLQTRVMASLRSGQVSWVRGFVLSWFRGFLHYLIPAYMHPTKITTRQQHGHGPHQALCPPRRWHDRRLLVSGPHHERAGAGACKARRLCLGRKQYCGRPAPRGEMTWHEQAHGVQTTLTSAAC